VNGILLTLDVASFFLDVYAEIKKVRRPQLKALKEVGFTVDFKMCDTHKYGVDVMT
jgi:hypothetical protein